MHERTDEMIGNTKSLLEHPTGFLPSNLTFLPKDLPKPVYPRFGNPQLQSKY
jgi:hypothetical protein